MTPTNRPKWPIAIWAFQLVAAIPAILFVAANIYAEPTSKFFLLAGGLLCSYVAFVLYISFSERGKNWIHTRRLQLLAFLFSGLFAYLLCETLLTGALVLGYRVPSFDEDASIWLFEDSQDTIRFDPIRGVRLTSTPARTARITHGTIEYLSEVRGNNQGFPDRDDFTAYRDGARPRVAVFGDSFSAASYLEKNWPDYAEDVTANHPEAVQLLNFSISGGGVANWWSVLTRLVKQDNYEIDGIIFAVYGDNLHRRFCMAEHQGQSRHMFGRARTWKPDKFPATTEDAKAYLKTLDGFIVGEDEFEQALAGQWTPPTNGPNYAPHIARNIQYAFVKAWDKIPFPNKPNVRKNEEHWEADRLALLEDMRKTIQELDRPVLVVFLPTKFQLLEDGDNLAVPGEVQNFSSLLDADLINGADAFAGMTRSEINASWFPYDGHWAQPGSDRFARFMSGQISKWLKRENGDPPAK